MILTITALRNESQFNLLTYRQDKTMILKSLKIFSQNIHKNRLLTDTILENNKNFNISLTQEPLQLIVCSIPSFMSEEEENIIGAPNYPLWIMFAKPLHSDNKYLRVFTYIKIRLIKLCFFAQKRHFQSQEHKSHFIFQSQHYMFHY